MKHLVLVGACYLDTILSVPHYPDEDSKLRATSLLVRRGGNCPNSLEVLQQLLEHGRDGCDDVRLYLVAALPNKASPASRHVAASFGTAGCVDLSHCLYRDAHVEAASSHIIRSQATGSRTIVNHSDLPEMSVDEFEAVVRVLGSDGDSWWHFEGRIPDTMLACMRLLRASVPTACISVELEKPGRQGLSELAAEADVVLYSRSWAESRGYESAEACLQGEGRRQGAVGLCTWGADGAAAMSQPSEACVRLRVEQAAAQKVSVVDTVGAGDTFTAGILYGLFCRREAWSVALSTRFAVSLATLKVQREGFDGLGIEVARALQGRP